MPRGARIALVLLQTALVARPMEVWLDARPLGPAHGAAAMLDASDGLFDRAIVADAADDERFLVADASEPVARLRFSDGSIAGGSTIVGGDASQSAAIALVGSVAWCHVDATAGQPCIVAENLLAKADGTGTRIACTCREAADVQGLAFALDKGVDALVISDADDLREAALIAKAQRAETAAPDEDAAAARNAPAGPVALERWTVSGVSDGGVADRVAVDFTTLLSNDEGLLVGSSAKALALVLGETATGGFVPPRPFRVNAGPVHSYVLAADGKTTYLSEVSAGDTLVVATRTAPRGERPSRQSGAAALRAVDLQPGGSVFLQQAETATAGLGDRPRHASRSRRGSGGAGLAGCPSASGSVPVDEVRILRLVPTAPLSMSRPSFVEAHDRAGSVSAAFSLGTSFCSPHSWPLGPRRGGSGASARRRPRAFRGGRRRGPACRPPWPPPRDRATTWPRRGRGSSRAVVPVLLVDVRLAVPVVRCALMAVLG